MKAAQDITAIMIGAGAIVSAGVLMTFVHIVNADAGAKTISSKPPSWQHIATPSPYGKPHSRSGSRHQPQQQQSRSQQQSQPRSRPKLTHRLPAEPAGWAASAEPTVNADIAALPTPPFPVRKPKKLRARIAPGLPEKSADPANAANFAEPASVASIQPPTLPEREKSIGASSDNASSDHAASDQIVAENKPEAAPAPAPAADPARKLKRLSPLTPLGSLDVAVTGVLGEETQEGQDTTSRQARAQPQPVNKTAGAQFCDNISNAAADARFAWQKKLLKETEEKVSKRIAELNIRIAEYRKWLARRNDFSRKAQGVVVNIYSKMKPDAAAQQLTILDEEMAAAVLTKLSPKVASAVMNEMNPKHAARLTSIISGAMTGPDNAPPPPPKGSGT
ncbi:MAG: MotE family protein [Alphaproteobacteria bacterium]